MIKLSRNADYGVVIVSHLARLGGRQQNAVEIAAATRIPQPMASKILKALARAELLSSHRGARGGYGLARPATMLTVAEVIEALDGPIALTTCSEATGHECGIERHCATRTNWRRINGAIREALEGITIDEMASPAALSPLGRIDRASAAAA